MLACHPALSLQAVDGADGVFTVPAEQREHLTHHPASGDGRLYIQGLASMAAVWALDPQPGEEILDLAAAPGGKTSYIAACMQGQGRLAAVEPVKARFHRLKGWWPFRHAPCLTSKPKTRFSSKETTGPICSCNSIAWISQQPVGWLFRWYTNCSASTHRSTPGWKW
jgi:hypothetical protein